MKYTEAYHKAHCYYKELRNLGYSREDANRHAVNYRRLLESTTQLKSTKLQELTDPARFNQSAIDVNEILDFHEMEVKI